MLALALGVHRKCKVSLTMGPGKNNPGSLIGRNAVLCACCIGAILHYASYRHSLHNSATSYLQSGISHAAARGYDDAVADFSEAIRIDSRFALAFYDRGLTYYLKHDVGVGGLR
jgi:tetratricopeptide (TPR) repeat protein